MPCIYLSALPPYNNPVLMAMVFYDLGYTLSLSPGDRCPVWCHHIAMSSSGCTSRSLYFTVEKTNSLRLY